MVAALYVFLLGVRNGCLLPPPHLTALFARSLHPAQNQSLAAAQQATAALSSIQNLASQQAAAQQALANAVMQQVTAIKSAVRLVNGQQIITLTQALALWKKARRDAALTTKAAKLATVPCTSKPVVHNNFTLDNGYAETVKTPRERNVG